MLCAAAGGLKSGAVIERLVKCSTSYSCMMATMKTQFIKIHHD